MPLFKVYQTFFNPISGVKLRGPINLYPLALFKRFIAWQRVEIFASCPGCDDIESNECNVCAGIAKDLSSVYKFNVYRKLLWNKWKYINYMNNL
jgi:hypothetical protein